VHLIKNVQPLPKKVVEAIQDGNFVDFAWFPVLEEGPAEGDWKEGPGELGGRSSSSSERKRRERKEVPDLSMWSTCFSLFQVAWASHKPDMWLPLTAYRETIFRLARRHPWAQVVKYDRRFRQEAAGRDDVKWEKEKVPLVMELMSVSTHGKGETRSGGGSSGVVPRRGTTEDVERVSASTKPTALVCSVTSASLRMCVQPVVESIPSFSVIRRGT